MIFRVILIYFLIYISAVDSQDDEWTEKPMSAKCLTGYMTDLQSWVDEYGRFTNTKDIMPNSIDVSASSNGAVQIQHQILALISTKNKSIQYLNFARCKLTTVPAVFSIKDNTGTALYNTVRYMTFYGNNFSSNESSNDKYSSTLNATQANGINVDRQNLRIQYTMWSVGFQSFTFGHLRELDLRACRIQALGSNTFRRMPKIRNLYLGENNIHYIGADVFNSLTALRHLDLSRNYAYDENNILIDLVIESPNMFSNISLESLDLSSSHIGQRNIAILKSVEHSVTRMSVCYTGLSRNREIVFNFSRLKYLDVSGNKDILNSPNFIQSFQNSLRVLYAEVALIRNLEMFFPLTKLEILKLSNNDISILPQPPRPVLPNLLILDLNNNRVTSWFTKIFSSLPKLQLLSLKNNNINVITQEMYNDIKNLKYISLSDNFLVCNCHSRDMYEVGLKNELRKKESLIESGRSETDILSFHIGFSHYNNIIKRRRNITEYCKASNTCDLNTELEIVGNYLLLDYEPYPCLLIDNGKTTEVFNLDTCSNTMREIPVPDSIKSKWNRFFLFIIPGLLLPLLLFIYIYRKNFRYFLITMKNSATLSLLHKNIPPDDGTIYNYDVFVSYCNEDRGWVLDSLLPHVERDCNVSVCLHERDFQVGLSILENIVSCMDRSRSIMLIISKKFLQSQWCQFEMHLAQHRLLETRREDLVLILLEEIPRMIRPNTLHYLMLTKTYIVWPKDESEQELFWRRMKKSVVTHKLKRIENVSLA